MHEVVKVFVEPHSGFDTGWLVGLGTIALAAFTAVLARRTTDLATSTADDVSSQHRPILVPSVEQGYLKRRQDGLRVQFENVGAGPALGVQAMVLDTAAAGARDTAVVPPGQSRWLTFPGVSYPAFGQPFSVEILCRDVAERTWTTTVMVQTNLLTSQGTEIEDTNIVDVRIGDGRRAPVPPSTLPSKFRQWRSARKRSWLKD